MQLRSLTHVIQAVRALARPESISVLGSSSLLATDPSLGDPGQPLELSMDADLLLKPCTDRLAAVVHEAVGENSLFHREFGVYADLMKPDVEATLPLGWQSRAIRLGKAESASCLSPQDLATVKIRVGRAKDLELLDHLLRRGLVSLESLRNWFQSAELGELEMFSVGRRLAMLEARR
jgi:hypothetical protein